MKLFLALSFKDDLDITRGKLWGLIMNGERAKPISQSMVCLKFISVFSPRTILGHTNRTYKIPASGYPIARKMIKIPKPDYPISPFQSTYILPQQSEIRIPSNRVEFNSSKFSSWISKFTWVSPSV